MFYSNLFRFAMALAASLCVAASTTKVITVDDDGRQCPSAQAATIQQALAQAAAGDEIRVCRGSYVAPSGGFVIERPGIRLIAKGPLGTVEITAGSGGKAHDAAIRVAADNVWIEGFEIKGFAKRKGSVGISVGGPSPATGAVIKGNLVHSNEVGVSLDDGARNTEVSDNQIVRNRRQGILASSAGTMSWDAGETRIQHNDVFDNGLSGLTFDEGIGVVGMSGRIVVASNKAGGNPVGLRIERSSGVLAERNDFSGNRLGVDIRAANRNILRFNKVNENSGVGGIWVRRGSCENELTSNEIERNRNDGIRIFDDQCSRNLLAGNLVKGNSVHDIHPPAHQVSIAAQAPVRAAKGEAGSAEQ